MLAQRSQAGLITIDEFPERLLSIPISRTCTIHSYLPPFVSLLSFFMAQRTQIPGTPQVTSPTPPASDSGNDSYFAPTTRSHTRQTSSATISEDKEDSDSSLEARARARSRSPLTGGRRKSGTVKKPPNLKAKQPASPPQSNGHLSPPSAVSSSYWRDISRSPSPLGLIPIHRHWRSFIHRHEIPRKALHLSIGFLTMDLYARGLSTHSIHPWLLSALIPIASVDYIRHVFPSINKIYIKVVGALMRESEVDGWNGVIWYLLGTWIVLRFYPPDVGVMSVLLLSWCDTAASTFGRLYGRYTPRIRKGKSLAGSLAAATVGVATAAIFWGWAVPRWGYTEGFLFDGHLQLPTVAQHTLGLEVERASVDGWLSVGILSVWSGLVASASEVIDMFGWDDNLTIPVLSGLGLWGFLKAFS